MTRYTGYLCPYLSPLLSSSFSHSLAPSHTHTAAKICEQVAIIVCRCWSSLLLLVLLYCSWQQQLAIVATTLARPPPLFPHPSLQWVLKNTLHVQNWSANATKSTRKKRSAQLQAKAHAKKAIRWQIAFASKSPIESRDCIMFDKLNKL